MVEFCKQQQVSPASFYAWRRRLAEAPRASFVPVHVAAASHDGLALELQRPDGTLIRVFHFRAPPARKPNTSTASQGLLDVLFGYVTPQ